ncbi:uncharacterized protein LOC111361749 [Spodoptera litura]|uniref:Regulatory protein zeste n=1 Tax=Spodoptera litura TaxID=69820 RepID=A0A9J7J3S4_SPOLT|nr:uncharacterized protein LOC111361749 [Spodoptera litura]
MSAQRKRGCNYTNEETAKLLELVEQHRTSIEDKRTGAIYLRQKQEAWDKICLAYNAVATSGVRTVGQLRVMYDNKKQKARKALALHNKNEYIKNNVVLSSYNISETEFKDAIQHETNDKGQCSKTDGGSWCPSVTESNQKILELLKDQVTPLHNEFDSAATFFGDTINIMGSEDHTQNVVIIDNGVLSGRHEADLSSKMNATPKCGKTPKIVKRRQNATTPHRPKRNGQVNYKVLYFKRKS